MQCDDALQIIPIWIQGTNITTTTSVFTHYLYTTDSGFYLSGNSDNTTPIAEYVTTNRKKSLQMQRIHKYTFRYTFTKYDPIPVHNHSPKGSGLKIDQT